MNRHFRTLTIPLALVALLAGCSSMDKYNPFTDTPVYQEISRAPTDAVEYRCEGDKKFYVRMLDKDNAAWLIYPDREVRLDKTGSGNRYSNGVATLDINGEQSSLNDGPKVAYKACKAVTAKP